MLFEIRSFFSLLTSFVHFSTGLPWPFCWALRSSLGCCVVPSYKLSPSRSRFIYTEINLHKKVTQNKHILLQNMCQFWVDTMQATSVKFVLVWPCNVWRMWKVQWCLGGSCASHCLCPSEWFLTVGLYVEQSARETQREAWRVRGRGAKVLQKSRRKRGGSEDSGNLVGGALAKSL